MKIIEILEIVARLLMNARSVCEARYCKTCKVASFQFIVVFRTDNQIFMMELF